MAGVPPQTTPVRPAAEARQVTIVKCDLVGSTRIKKELDLQGQADFEQGFADIVLPLAEQSGAEIERFEGDGAFLIFGLSEPREDAAEAALRMALALVETVRATTLLPGVELSIRVGVGSGAIAAIRGSRLSNVAGLTIDLTERLRAAAEPNQILLCDQTRRLASGYFEYEDLGPVVAKGFENGVQAWRLCGARAVDSRFEAQRSYGNIVGRDEVRSRLADAWRQALAGHPQAVVLTGDAGIGKSRLARAALEAARADGAETLSIDCSPSAINTPLFPVGVLLRRSAGITSGMAPAAALACLHRLVETLLPADDVEPALDYLSPLIGLSAATPAGATDVQERTIAILAKIVAGLFQERPGFVLCEDLHWADDSTLQLIARLFAEAQGRVLVLGTSRVAPPGALGAAPGLAVIALPPLGPEASLELVRGLSGGAALPADAVATIVDRCEGVPLLIEELTRSALERPLVIDEAVTPAKADGVPLPLQLVVENRLAQHAEIAPIAKAASVLGREISVPLLSTIAGVDAEVVHRLSAQGLLDPYEGGERARFRHAMICEAVYATVMRREAVGLHSRVADALIGPFAGTPDATADVLAEHLRKAERFREAIETRLLAAADTAARGAYVESEGHSRAALAILPSLADRDEARSCEFRLLIQLGVALSGRLGYAAPEVEACYLAAYAICGGDAEAEALYPILRGLSTVNLMRGELRAAYDISVQAHTTAERSGNVAFVIDAMSVLCYTTFYHRTYAECLDWADRCLALYAQHHGHALVYPVPQDAKTAALSLLPTIYWLVGRPDEAEGAVQRCLDHVQSLDKDFDRALIACWLAGFRLTQQRYDDSAEFARQALVIAEDFADWFGISMLTSLVARANLTRDAADIAAAVEMLDAYEAAGVSASVPHYCLNIAHACVRAGMPDAARRLQQRGMTCAQQSEEPRMLAELLVLQARLEADASRGEALLREALDLATAQGAVAVALLAAAHLALRLPEGPQAEAAALLDALESRAPAPTEPDWMAAGLARLRGRLTTRTHAPA